MKTLNVSARKPSNAKLTMFTRFELARTTMLIGTLLRKTRRQWQRERHQTKGLMSGTIAVHVRYKSS